MALSPKNTDVKALFNTIAPEYDKMNNIISFGTHKKWRQKVMAKMTIPMGAQILDLATGTADWALALADSSDETTHVTGLDFSEEMLAIGQKKVDLSDYPDRITLVQGDAMALPFDDHTFDIVTIGFGLRNLPDPTLGLQEMFRILKPGGQLVVLETSQPDNRIIKPFWKLYFGKVMPVFGKIFANGKYTEYQYLDQTTENFMDYMTLGKLMLNTGFKKVTISRFNLGAAAAHYATK
ncbi:bifunctional demethylmenaquinone methyltransferase/2-methoxy-6-polyprenyl-1,4-benzoquinol methylase UbiE [Leuconostoc carnosum]|uniref:bifunctional demethylmenaquinone methyltransferase/2-methoxy-6-polyprenyl-1,4-benzoquinol methylase UbiE n=1 Tax=Leuconostoc TaxID=1243 RepID=UPI000D50AB88|nr:MULTISPECIES: bifunctional demethylmenaquinone methyltransferase/2-methoxy-6-polyprenyl-1,4-benzoquinol methylase UbiE [Leuconostoc]KAA8327192.1 bifunctional demethylmenaquinone methyltransferase/2-methoxy-6-polyprenyl-1,4-benzoquinol methylase UbiE [Leuconostoc carnosum]KAA8364281.1 bifunctional demethylmenaquinone methyltransferase/2-methoxy-6-polyprenyl-1,4-benzoquinol methylase UbiE [Leuconostoc carnosum]KAA8367174.1 bifunctional demethylmenaquinone methyltransferase/2-methoxy-6-polypreny